MLVRKSAFLRQLPSSVLQIAVRCASLVTGTRYSTRKEETICPILFHRPQFPRPTLPDGVDSVPFVHGLTGFVDAGNTVFITTQHLLGSLEKELVANFTADAVIEYTNRRPAMLMRDGKLEAFHPHDTVDLLRQQRPSLFPPGRHRTGLALGTAFS